MKLDVDANPTISQSYGIQGIPAVKAFHKGKVVAECITCHTYHAPIAAQTVAESASSVKEMLLGKR